MKSFFTLLLIICCYPVFALQTLTGKVVSIADGDTFTILTANKEQVKIRLYGIDCPEAKQDFGSKAKQFTSTLCFQKIVKAEIKNNDRYGRKIAVVHLPDGRIINKEILRAGLAWHYKHYDNSKELALIEENARKNKTGLWSLKNPVAPWEFRSNKRKKQPQKNKKLCIAYTKSGKHCQHAATTGNRCWQHRI